MQILIKILEEFNLYVYSDRLSRIETSEGMPFHKELKAIAEDREINQYYPSISAIAENLPANPKILNEIIPAGFIPMKELDEYGLFSYSLGCNDFSSLGFSDFEYKVVHRVWDLKHYEHNTAINKNQKILVSYNLDNSHPRSLDDIRNQTVQIRVFSERVVPLEESNTTIFKDRYCGVCNIERSILYETKTKNTAESISNFINLFKNYSSSREAEWQILASLC